MKPNISMTNGVAKSGEFKYERKSRIVKAYDTEYTIPTKTVAFAKKIEDAIQKISKCTTTSATTRAMLDAISLFIGDDEIEKNFPADKFNEIDVDEVLAFWRELYYEYNKNQQDIIAKYSPATTVRR